MPDNIKWVDGTESDVLTSGLNSLADGNTALTAAIDNDAGLDLYADLQLEIAYTTSTPSAGTKVAEVYLLPTVDGTNYPEGTAGTPGNIPQKALLAAIFESRVPSTSAIERLVAPGIPLPPRDFKLLLKNTSGKTLHASLNVLSIRVYKLQIVTA